MFLDLYVRISKTVDEVLLNRLKICDELRLSFMK